MAPAHQVPGARFADLERHPPRQHGRPGRTEVAVVLVELCQLTGAKWPTVLSAGDSSITAFEHAAILPSSLCHQASTPWPGPTARMSPVAGHVIGTG